jgi:hypothetical protein
MNISIRAGFKNWRSTGVDHCTALGKDRASEGATTLFARVIGQGNFFLLAKDGRLAKPATFVIGLILEAIMTIANRRVDFQISTFFRLGFDGKIGFICGCLRKANKIMGKP